MSFSSDKKRKKNLAELQESSNEEFEGFSPDQSINESIDVGCNCKLSDIENTLKEIKGAIAHLMQLKNGVNTSCNDNCELAVIGNTLKDLKDAIDYVVEIKNDFEEFKITLCDIQSKLDELLEKGANSIVDIHQILSSLPYTTISGVEKVNKNLNSGTIFSKMVSDSIGNHYVI